MCFFLFKKLPLFKINQLRDGQFNNNESNCWCQSTTKNLANLTSKQWRFVTQFTEIYNFLQNSLCDNFVRMCQ